METDQEKRKRLVWEIDRRLQEDQARPIVYHLRFATRKSFGPVTGDRGFESPAGT
jgi:hypothetical protein